MTDSQDNVPFGPSPEVYAYRCSRCECELEINEAIIDFEISLAKFEGEYAAGTMPMFGCPSCDQKTMAYTGIKSPPESG